MDEINKAPVPKKLAPVLIVLLIFGIGGYLFYLVQTGRLAAGNPVCSVCKRPLHPAQTFIVVSKDGKEHPSCCPRCGLRFAIENRAKATKATDFASSKRIDPESAYFVEGSDVMECCGSSTLLADGGMLCEMHYDRCMPSLLTFAGKDTAENFQHQHGGHIISFAEAEQSVWQQMGHTLPETTK
jgi:DNA-directed RNA polymerase subunit RPC12/RpoP